MMAGIFKAVATFVLACTVLMAVAGSAAAMDTSLLACWNNSTCGTDQK